MRYLIVVEVDEIYPEYQDIMWDKDLAQAECNRLKCLNPNNTYTVMELPNQ